MTTNEIALNDLHGHMEKLGTISSLRSLADWQLMRFNAAKSGGAINLRIGQTGAGDSIYAYQQGATAVETNKQGKFRVQHLNNGLRSASIALSPPFSYLPRSLWPPDAGKLTGPVLALVQYYFLSWAAATQRSTPVPIPEQRDLCHALDMLLSQKKECVRVPPITTVRKARKRSDRRRKQAEPTFLSEDSRYPTNDNSKSDAGEIAKSIDSPNDLNVRDSNKDSNESILAEASVAPGSAASIDKFFLSHQVAISKIEGTNNGNPALFENANGHANRLRRIRVRDWKKIKVIAELIERAEGLSEHARNKRAEIVHLREEVSRISQEQKEIKAQIERLKKDSREDPDENMMEG